MSPMPISLCFPDEEKSCFACCPPIRPQGYEHIDHKNIIRRVLRENSDNLSLKDNSMIPITGFSCWGLGYIDRQHKHIGCMLHPFQNGGVDLRYRIDYGEKCSREACEEQKVFSRLSPAEQEFWLGLSTGLDSFAYSSRKINPLFRMLNWGSEILSCIARSSIMKRTTRQSFLESFPFFKTDLSPKGNSYLVLRVINRIGTGLLEYEALRKRYESFVSSLIKGLYVKSTTSLKPFTHLLDIDPLFADFLRLSGGFSRINLDEAVEIKSIVDKKLDEFQISLEA